MVCYDIIYNHLYKSNEKFTLTIFMKVKVAQTCLTLCDPMDYTVLGILQARILEWVACPSPVALPDPGMEPGSQILFQLSYKGRPKIFMN